MRIISGSMRGTKLNTLEGLNTRPTLDRVKEALFSKLDFEVNENPVVLDLFSGSGALGLESISRGAKYAVLCDNSRDAIRIINSNVEKTRTQDKTLILNMDYEKALNKCKQDGLKFDLVLLDPPYKTNYAVNATKMIIDLDLLDKDGIIVIESDERESIIQGIKTNVITNYDSIELYDEKKYGRVYLFFIRKNLY